METTRSKIFQWVVLGICGALALGAVVVFSMVGGGKQAPGGIERPLVVWGMLPEEAFYSLREAGFESPVLAQAEYKAFPKETYYRSLTEALATGKGPDLIIIDDASLYAQQAKIIPITFERIPERTFRDTYIEGAEVFLMGGKIFALPFAVDPLVLFWNRDHLSSAGIAEVPKTWSAFFTLAPKLSIRTDESRIVRSAVAFGEYRNVMHAKEIIATLILQAGAPLALSQAGSTRIEADISGRGGVNAGEAALRFYTEFSNPVKTVYSWSRAQKNSRDAFLAGDLTFYPGFASEVSSLRLANPNLNFDVAPMPQSSTSPRRSTFGRMYAFAVPKAAAAPEASLFGATSFTGETSVKQFSEFMNMAPARRSLLGVGQTNAFRATLFESAIMARSWLDPNPEESDAVFLRLVENITSGRTQISGAVSGAQTQLQTLF